jgi:hypothetical protein
MLRHALQITATTLLALGSMFYPFMPGSYDSTAVAFSGMASVLSVAGLLLIPLGAAWLLYEFTHRNRSGASTSRKSSRYWFAICSLVVLLIVGFGMALAATQAGVLLAICVLVLTGYGVQRAALAIKPLRFRDHSGFHPAPLYLVIVPSVLAIARFSFLESAVEISRHRTIMGSTQFIAAIEEYRVRYGRYPASLESVHHDYDTPTVGVERYRYEPQGDAFNVFFEQPTWPIGTQEFVMFNPRDEHAMIVHNQDLLESPRENVEQERNYHRRAARDAGVPHWKYFWFD